MSEVKVKTSTRAAFDGACGRPIDVVEIWIGGVRFATECPNAPAARALALVTAQKLGLMTYERDEG